MANHPNRRQAVEQWAESRQTSIEVAEAIHTLANGHRATANRIWEEPTDAEMAQVTTAAFAATDENELLWGVETIRR